MSFGDFVKKASDFEIMLAMIARQELKNQFEVVEYIKSKGWDVDETRIAIAEACNSDCHYQLFRIIDCVVNLDEKRKLRGIQRAALHKYGIVPLSREHFVFLVGVESQGTLCSDPFMHVLACNFNDRLDYYYHLGLNMR